MVVVVGIYRWRPQVRPARFTMFPSLTRLQNAQSCAPPVSDWVKSPPKRDRQLDKAPLELSYPNFYCFSLFSSAFISNALTSSPLIGHFLLLLLCGSWAMFWPFPSVCTKNLGCLGPPKRINRFPWLICIEYANGQSIRRPNFTQRCFATV